MSDDLFVVLDDSNSVYIRVTDVNDSRVQEELVTLDQPKAINFAVFCFMKKYSLPLRRLRVETRRPTETQWNPI